jgi:hypothetical protein
MENVTNETTAASSTTSESAAPQPGAQTTNEQQASSVPSPTNESSNSTTEAPATGQTGQNWEAEYKRLQAEHERINKSYAEARKKLISQGTEKNQYSEKLTSLETNIKQLAEALAKATAQPYDPDQFMEELRTQGPKALENHLKGALEKQAKEHQAKTQALEDRYRKLETTFVVKDCRTDSKNYPDFVSMEPTMAKIMDDLRQDYQAGLIANPDLVEPSELVPFLYNQAKLQHSQDAIKAAEAHGAAKATSELAREANTAVAAVGNQQN